MVKKNIFRSGVVFIHIFALGAIWGMLSAPQASLKRPIDIPELRGSLHESDTIPVNLGPLDLPADSTYWV